MGCPLETRRTALPLVADRAAERLHRVRARVAHKEIEPRVRRVGLRHAAANLERQRAAPLRRLDKRRERHPPGEGAAAGDVLDHVAHHQAGLGRRRLRQHDADGRILRPEQAPRRQPKTVERLELVVAVADKRRGCRWLRGRPQRDGHSLERRIGRIGRLAGQRLVHAAMARRAAVEPRDVAEIVVEREVGQPELIDLQRAVEGVEHRQFKHGLAGVGAAVGERLLQQGEFRPMIGHRLGGRVLVGGDPPHDRVEILAVGVGLLEVERRLFHLGPLRIGQLQEFHLAGDRGSVGDRKLIVGTILVEFGLPQLERAGEQVLAELRPLHDVGHPGEQVATQSEPALGIGLRGELVDVGRDQRGGLGVLRYRLHPGDELPGEAAVDVRPAGGREVVLEFPPLIGIRLRVLRGDPRSRRPGLEVPESAGVLLPWPIVVGREHQHRRQEEDDRRHGEDDVEDLQVVPGLFVGGHGWNVRGSVGKHGGRRPDPA